MENKSQKYQLRQKAHRSPSYYAALVKMKVKSEPLVKPCKEVIKVDDEEREDPRTATKDNPIIIDD